MSKIKKIRIRKNCPPKIHEVAKARGAVNNFANDSGGSFLGADDDINFNPVNAASEGDSKIDYGSILNTAGEVVGAASKASTGRVSKKQFWSYRDEAYNRISLLHGKESWVQLPGNPFEAFTHANIKDSPVKNYRNDLNAFNVMLKQYYPEVFAAMQGQQNTEQRKQNAGTGLNIDIDPGSVQEILQGVSSDYISELQRKKNAGLPLSNAEEKILAAYEYLRGKIKDGAKKKVSQEIGDWLIENWPLVIFGLILLIILLKKK